MRLIDADALLEELPVHPDGGMRSVKEKCLMIRVRQTVKEAPTVATDTNVLGKWVSVKDRLPKEEGAYLVAFKPPLTKVTIAWWATREYGWYDLEYNFHTDSVSHWMPLPESPEEVSEDEGKRAD